MGEEPEPPDQISSVSYCKVFGIRSCFGHFVIEDTPVWKKGVRFRPSHPCVSATDFYVTLNSLFNSNRMRHGSLRNCSKSDWVVRALSQALAGLGEFVARRSFDRNRVQRRFSIELRKLQHIRTRISFESPNRRWLKTDPRPHLRIVPGIWRKSREIRGIGL